MTLFTWVIMLFYIAQKTEQLIWKLDPTTDYNTGVIRDVDTEVAQKFNNQKENFMINASDLNFDFNFWLVNPNIGVNATPIDPKLFDVTV